jgi:small GTP-binding protein
MINFSFGVCLLGDASVGKTSLVDRIVNDKFNYKQNTTIGVEFTSKYFKTILNNKEYFYKWSIWDTAGQEAYNSLIKSYYRNGPVYILMFDKKDKLSFNNLKKWYDSINSLGTEKKFIYIVGNKIDNSNYNITYNDIIKKVEDDNFKYYELSVKNNLNCDLLVNSINNDLLNYIFDKDINKFEKKNVIKFYEKKIILKNENNFSDYNCC